MAQYFKCYDSETTGACFAMCETTESKFNDPEYFALTREQCEKYHVYSRIPNFKFDWEKQLDT